jgi:dipeptidyl aminopeptidase/acylaminoacyl peptidase
MNGANRLAVPVLALSLLAAGCSGGASDGESAAPEPAQGPSMQSSPPASTPTATPAPATTAPSAAPSATAAPSAAAKPPNPVSLQALMQKGYDGRGLSVGRVLNRTDAYTRYFVTYKSGQLTISGIMNVPRGRGPFPVLILNHGYIDPDVYTNGRGLMREQDYFARHGYVVLHTDYRNHAQSSDDPNADLNLRLGYTEDVINAAIAIKKSTLPYLDGDRVGLLGRSMGGGVTLNAMVVRPDLFRAGVIFASVSSDTVDNFNRWTRGDAQRRELASDIIAKFGSPEANPAFWRNVSPVKFFDRIRAPILIHHGTADDTCPIAWSRETLSALKAARKDVQMFTYAGEHHAFGPQWPRSMQRTVAFLDAHMSA